MRDMKYFLDFDISSEGSRGEKILEAIRKEYPEVSENSTVSILDRDYSEEDGCAGYGDPPYHEWNRRNAFLVRIDGRLLALYDEHKSWSAGWGVESKSGYGYKASASASEGRKWLNRIKKEQTEAEKRRKEYGRAAAKAAKQYHLPMGVALAVGADNCEEFVGRVIAMRPLPKEIESDLAAGIQRRKYGIRFALNLNGKDTGLSHRTNKIGQEHSTRIADYLLENAPKKDPTIVYSAGDD